MSTWKRDFASGLVVVVPILVILFVAHWLYTALSTLPFVPRITPTDLPPTSSLRPLYEFAEVTFALVLFVLIVFSAGYLMRTTAGRLAEGLLDDAINRVPGLRVIYNASKLAVETALTGTEDLQTPVKLEPWEGMRMTAFKTGKRTADGREVLFMPTAPNITTGFVLEVEPADFEETDERVEEALTRILSAGFGEGTGSAADAAPGTAPVEATVASVGGTGEAGAEDRRDGDDSEGSGERAGTADQSPGDDD